ncbi:hypothetical protein ACJJTC_006670 [Scirpophaga incertulas]
MSENIKKLNKVRASLRGLLTRAENHVSKLQFLQNEEIDSRLNSLHDTLQKLQNLQKDIELDTDEDNLEEEIQYRFDFEELYTIVRTKYMTLRNSNECQPGTSSTLIRQTFDNETCSEKLPKLNFQPFQEKETFQNFKKRLNVFFLMNKITNAEMKVYTLLSTLSPELHEKLCDLCSPEEPTKMEYETLTKLLDEYIDPKPSTWSLQHKFISRLQGEHETIPVYAAELKKLTTNCEFQCVNCSKTIAEKFLIL